MESIESLDKRYSYPWDPVDPWSYYIHNRRNGQRIGITEISLIHKYLNTDDTDCTDEAEKLSLVLWFFGLKTPLVLIRREKAGSVITTSPASMKNYLLLNTNTINENYPFTFLYY